MDSCLFCRIIRGDLPAKKVYEDDHTFAFEDIQPQGPTHVLVVPKKHLRGLKEAEPEDAELLGHCQLVAAQIARERGIEDGYRTILNVGPGAGQTVFHLHLHVGLGNRANPRNRIAESSWGYAQKHFDPILCRRCFSHGV